MSYQISARKHLTGIRTENYFNRVTNSYFVVWKYENSYRNLPLFGGYLHWQIETRFVNIATLTKRLYKTCVTCASIGDFLMMISFEKLNYLFELSLMFSGLLIILCGFRNSFWLGNYKAFVTDFCTVTFSI